MEEIITFQNYKEYEAAFDGSVRRASEEFVFIGYMCKQGRDTDILKESGYANVNEFARSRYGIDKTMVSRFIGINDRFSEGGNSIQLKEQYRKFGYTKLAIMLLLPDSINEELSPAFSKAEINAIKEEYDQEKKVTDLEILMEEKPEGQQDMEDDLSKAVWQLGHDNPELYKEIYEAAEDATFEALQEAFAPSGEGIHSVRVPGTGRLIISVKGTDRDITLINIRTGEKTGYAWDLLYRAVCSIVKKGYEVEKSWEEVYHGSFPVKEEPKKPEVAPVQQNGKDKKSVQKKKPKVTKAKTVEKPVNTQYGRAEPVEKEEPETVEEIRKDETENLSTETIPPAEPAGEETGSIENVTGISEIVTEGPAESKEPDVQEKDGSSPDAYKPQLTKEEYRTRRESHISYIKAQIAYIQQDMENELWNMVKDAMENGLNRINELIRLDNAHEEYLEKEENKEDKEEDEDADE